MSYNEHTMKTEGMIPNSTQVPHIIIREWMPRLTDVELRVLLVVTDQTLGWEADAETGRRKVEDWISNHQLAKKTGKSGFRVSLAVKSLIEEHHLIEAVDSRGKRLDTAEKRQSIGTGGKIFYRLSLKSPEISLFDTIKKPSTKSVRSTEPSTNCAPTKRQTTKETSLQNLYIYPDWLNKEAWEEWMLYRSEKKKALTKTSIKLQISFLEKHIRDHAEIIRTSIRNGWTGLFPLKQQDLASRGPYKTDAQRADESRRAYEQEEREAADSAKANDRARLLREQAAAIGRGMKIST